MKQNYRSISKLVCLNLGVFMLRIHCVDGRCDADLYVSQSGTTSSLALDPMSYHFQFHPSYIIP